MEEVEVERWRGGEVERWRGGGVEVEVEAVVVLPSPPLLLRRSPSRLRKLFIGEVDAVLLRNASRREQSELLRFNAL